MANAADSLDTGLMSEIQCSCEIQDEACTLVVQLQSMCSCTDHDMTSAAARPAAFFKSEWPSEFEASLQERDAADFAWHLGKP